jgi:hypothetical protein
MCLKDQGLLDLRQSSRVTLEQSYATILSLKIRAILEDCLPDPELLPARLLPAIFKDDLGTWSVNTATAHVRAITFALAI